MMLPWSQEQNDQSIDYEFVAYVLRTTVHDNRISGGLRV